MVSTAAPASSSVKVGFGGGAATLVLLLRLTHVVVHGAGGPGSKESPDAAGNLPSLPAQTSGEETAASPEVMEGPCDILGAAGNPCVAAHSTVRALYGEYDGPLYTVLHTQSNLSADVYALKPGGFANVQQHERLCPKQGDCVISSLMDQSGNGNHLAPRDDRGFPQRGRDPPRFGHLHNPVDATRHKIHVGGNSTQVYGMYFDPGMGYKNNRTKGVATGDDPETMYAVMTGKRWGNGCCFDYGNSEVGGFSDGAGTMEVRSVSELLRSTLAMSG